MLNFKLTDTCNPTLSPALPEISEAPMAIAISGSWRMDGQMDDYLTKHTHRFCLKSP